MRKKIWLYNDLAFGGGAEIVLRDVANYLAAHGYRVTLTTDQLLRTIRPAYSRRIRYYNRSYPPFAKQTRIAHFIWRAINYIYRRVLVPYLDNKKYDAVIAFKNGPCMRKASEMKASNKFAWSHTDYSTFYWTKHVFGSEEAEKECLEKFTKVICVSKAAKTSIIDVIGDPGNLIVAYNPIDYATIQKKAQEAIPVRKENMPLFVSVGRLAPEKQFDFLLTACRNLQDSYRFQTWIIGGGDQAEHLKKRLQVENIRNVTMFGQQNNPYPYLAQADCYICCSQTECHPIAIQEATVLGVPVLTTDYPAACEVVDSRMGTIVENSAEALEEAMASILRCPEKLHSWRKFLAEEFSVESMWEPRLQRIIQIIESKSDPK